jgi:hypothetical protein
MKTLISIIEFFIFLIFFISGCNKDDRTTNQSISNQDKLNEMRKNIIGKWQEEEFSGGFATDKNRLDDSIFRIFFIDGTFEFYHHDTLKVKDKYEIKIDYIPKYNDYDNDSSIYLYSYGLKGLLQDTTDSAKYFLTDFRKEKIKLFSNNLKLGFYDGSFAIVYIKIID